MDRRSGFTRAQLTLTFLAALAVPTAAPRTAEAATCTFPFTGVNCDQCMPNYYGSSCAPCPGLVGGVACLGQGSCSDGAPGNGTCTCNAPYFGVVCQYALITLTPTHGPTAGGTSLTITGAGFGAAGASVTIGGAACGVLQQSSTSITCVTPPGSGLNQPVHVIVGPSGAVLSGLVFNYDSPPPPPGVSGTITRLSTGSASDQQNAPAISGTNVVWTEATTAAGGGANNFDMVLDDLGSSGVPVDLTNTPLDQEFLEDIDGTNVVWTRTSAASPGDIVLYDLATNTESIIGPSTASVHFAQPAIRGQYATFLRFTPSQVDVFLYDVASRRPVGLGGLITSDAAIQSRPRVGSNTVVYEDYTNGNADILGYDILTRVTFPIATGPNTQITPDLDGNTVVYVQAVGGTDQLFAYDLTTRVTTQLTSSVSSKILPRISGYRIIWSDDRAGNLDLYYYDLATNTEQPLVTGTGDQFLSDIDGDRVVYTDNSAGFEQVYLFTFESTNAAPIASAGVDQTLVYAATPPTVQLDGCASSDDGRPNPPGTLTYQWQQVGGVATVTLSNPASCNPTFVAPALGVSGSDVLSFQLTVSDSQLSSQATVNITLTNADRAPECLAAAPSAVTEGTVGVALDGSASFDPDGDAIASTWTETSGPALTLTTPNAAIATFTAPPIAGNGGATQTFTFVHTVSDGELASSCSVTVVVDKIDHCPLANAGPARAADEGTLVALDGSASTDPDGDTLAYAWNQTGGPAVALDDAASATPRFIAPLVGPGGADLTFALAVDDQFGCVQSAFVTVHIADVGDGPSCGTARANRDVVWPPNHKLVPVHVVDVTTNGLPTTVTSSAVFQDEPAGVGGDAVITADGLLVRADRLGQGNGRVYHVTFTATNAQGSCSGTVTTCVPHANGQGCVDGGALYSSLASP